MGNIHYTIHKKNSDTVLTSCPSGHAENTHKNPGSQIAFEDPHCQKFF